LGEKLEIQSKHVIIVDWTARRFRAWLMAPEGNVLRRLDTQDGVLEVTNRQFLQAFTTLCGAWLSQFPNIQVYMFGTIASTAGWREIENCVCPVARADLSNAAIKIPLNTTQNVIIFPGARIVNASGAVELMRAQAAASFGLGVARGIICIPGAQTKWVEIIDGQITRFYTFTTHEMTHLLLRMFNLVHTPDKQIDVGLFDRGLHLALRKDEVPRTKTSNQGFALRSIGSETLDPDNAHHPSLLRMIAEVRHHILVGNMHPRQLNSYLAGMVIGVEMLDALRLFGQPQEVYLIADGDDRALYQRALFIHEINVESAGFEIALYQFLLQTHGDTQSDEVVSKQSTEQLISSLPSLSPVLNTAMSGAAFTATRPTLGSLPFVGSLTSSLGGEG
jgi:2-dehydro-3-deoxygalactonokinase